MLESIVVIKKNTKSTKSFFTKYPLSVDHDGVMADTKGFVIQKVNQLLKTNYSIADIESWHWVKETAIKFGWSKQKAKELQEHLWYDPATLVQIPPTDKAVETMKWFYDRGIKVPVITSRPYDLEQSTRKWYAKHMPFVDETSIILNKNDNLRGDYFKVWVIKYLIKPAIHIEDSPDHAEKIIENTDTVVVFMSSSKILDKYGKSQLIRLLEKDASASLAGVKEKIMNHSIFS